MLGPFVLPAHKDIKKQKEELNPRQVLWIPGHIWNSKQLGPVKADVMIIGKNPGVEEEQECKLFCGSTSQYFHELLSSEGLDLDRAYVTNVLKFRAAGSRIAAWEAKLCGWFLHHEIKLVQPQFILLLGSDATKMLFHKGVERLRGSEILHTFPYGVTSTVWATIHPAGVCLRDMQLEPGLRRDLSQFGLLLKGTKVQQIEDYKYRYIYSAEELQALVDDLEQRDLRLFAIDCEWGGQLTTGGALRSVQLAWAPGEAACIVLRNSDLKYTFDGSIEQVGAELRRLLYREGVQIVGHNIRGDVPWYKKELDLDVLDRLEADTMLLDHLL